MLYLRTLLAFFILLAARVMMVFIGYGCALAFSVVFFTGSPGTLIGVFLTNVAIDFILIPVKCVIS